MSAEVTQTWIQEAQIAIRWWATVNAIPVRIAWHWFKAWSLARPRRLRGTGEQSVNHFDEWVWVTSNKANGVHVCISCHEPVELVADDWVHVETGKIGSPRTGWHSARIHRNVRMKSVPIDKTTQ